MGSCSSAKARQPCGRNTSYFQTFILVQILLASILHSKNGRKAHLTGCFMLAQAASVTFGQNTKNLIFSSEVISKFRGIFHFCSHPVCAQIRYSVPRSVLIMHVNVLTTLNPDISFSVQLLKQQMQQKYSGGHVMHTLILLCELFPGYRITQAIPY